MYKLIFQKKFFFFKIPSFWGKYLSKHPKNFYLPGYLPTPHHYQSDTKTWQCIVSISTEKTISENWKLSKISKMSHCNLGPVSKIIFNNLLLEVLHEASKTTCNLVVVLRWLDHCMIRKEILLILKSIQTVMCG